MIGHETKFKLGIVGCQGIGAHVARAATGLEGIQVVACCDVNTEVAEKLAADLEIPSVFSDASTMFTECPLDAVYLAVPHHLHYDLVVQAIERGLPVLCEKPITESIVSAEKLTAVVRASGVKVGINYQRRYDISLHTLVQAIQSGHVGKVQYIRVNIPWERSWDYFGNSQWHAQKSKAGGGTLITQASHYIDIVMQALLPAQPMQVLAFTDQLKFTGQIEVEDFAMGIIRMSTNSYVEICSSMVVHPQQPVRIEVYGTDGVVIFDDSKGALEFVGVDPYPTQIPPQNGIDGITRSLIAFRDWILDDNPYWIPIESALCALRCVDALYRASEQGCVVSV